MSTLTYLGQLTPIECCECHMDFGMTPDFEKARRDDHRNFYCPAGHQQHFPQLSTEEKLRSQLARAEGAETAARARANRAERQRAAARGQVTKMKNRVANGVCPCCNRHFANVERHMKSQHPDFTAAP